MQPTKPFTQTDWIENALAGETNLARREAPPPVPARPKDEQPWKQYDPMEPPSKYGFKLRLNRYQRALLEHVARHDFGSMHSCALRALVRGLELEAEPPKMDIRVIADMPADRE